MISDKWKLSLNITPISVVIISFHADSKPLSLPLQIPVNHMAQKHQQGNTVVQPQHSRLVSFPPLCGSLSLQMKVDYLDEQQGLHRGR